jgi:hypothetical protein
MKRNLFPLRLAYRYYVGNIYQNHYRNVMTFREWTGQILRCNGADALINLANNYRNYFNY